MTLRRKILLATASAIGLALVAAGYFINPLLLLGAAYHAKTLCSGVFVSGREASAVENEDVRAAQHPVLRLILAEVDRQQRTVSAGFLGLPQRVAVFRDGLGCTVAIGITAGELRAQTPPSVARPATTPDRSWPEGEAVELQRLPREIDAAALQAAVDNTFIESDPTPQRRTRAVVVAYDGRIVAERYAPGFSAATPLLGWSMTKTVANALVGILVGQGKLSLAAPAPIAEWHQPGDARAAITLDQLLHMTSGLAFTENYADPTSDVVTMLYARRDMAAYAAAKPLAAAPGTLWSYSTGTSNIVARIVRAASGNSEQEQRAFPRQALFDHLGMRRAILEPDSTGTFSGSSFMYASPHDWARFGLLYLRDGVWNGTRLLPPGWVTYSTTATPLNAEYGAHLWTKVPKPYFRPTGTRPNLPADAYHMIGHQGQFVSVIPSRKLVVVRLGLSAPWTWDQEGFLEQLLRAVPVRKM